MKKAFFRKLRKSSIEDASVLRKFTIFFLLMSLIPVIVLYYLYTQIRDLGTVSLTESNFSLTLALVIAGAVVGYWAMRNVLKRLIEVAHASQKTLETVLGPEKIRDLANEQNEIAVLARTFEEITSRLEENVKNLELAKRTLHSVLTKVGQGISTMDNIDSFLELIVETVVDAFSGKVGVLMLINKVNNEMYLKTVYGPDIEGKPNLNIKLTQEPFASVLNSRKTKIIKDSTNMPSGKEINGIFRTPMLCAPLVLRDDVIGIIAVCGKKKDEDSFQYDEVSLFTNLAMQTAVAVENSKLNEDVEKTYFETISALALAVDAKDRYSRGHLDRVAEYCVKIAEQMKLSSEDITTLRDAARLHDVGKIGVPDEILTKPAPLSDSEMAIMKKHAEIGESIIRPVRSLRHLCDVVRHHHEKLDGSGYPDGLKDENISLLARISAVADIFDAITTDRPYRKRFSHDEAFEELRNMNGKIDQRVVDTLVETLK